MGPLLLLITAVLATLVLYFWARKAQLEKQLIEEREENERIMNDTGVPVHVSPTALINVVEGCASVLEVPGALSQPYMQNR